jgi:hypothetical protein
MTHVEAGEGWVVELDERQHEIVVEAPEPLTREDACELAQAILKASSAINAARGRTEEVR